MVNLAKLSIALAAFASVSEPLLAERASANVDARIERYRDALAELVPTQARAALGEIDGTPRQLLALRAYLRAGESLPDRWSWTEEQIAAFGKSADYKQLMNEVELVRSRFEAANPGYTLYANTEVRSLDTQIERWNTNPSVERVAHSIQRAVSKELLESQHPDHPDDASVNRLAKFLLQWRPPRAAPLAAPGLSLHGQLRAIDFAVLKDGKIVAPTTLTAADAVWERDGWSAKLKQATEGTRFVGPLQSPHEPWHYEYGARVRTSKK